MAPLRGPGTSQMGGKSSATSPKWMLKVQESMTGCQLAAKPGVTSIVQVSMSGGLPAIPVVIRYSNGLGITTVPCINRWKEFPGARSSARAFRAETELIR